MSMKLYVGNLAFATSSQELQELFAQAGTVESASVVEDRERAVRVALVCRDGFQRGRREGIEQFNGKEVNGRALNVNEARPRENRAGGGGGGGGRGGFRGGNRSGGGGGGRDFGGRNDQAPRW